MKYKGNNGYISRRRHYESRRARGIYSSVLKSYNQQKFKLSKQRNELKERMESTPDGKTLYADEAATLDLQYNAVAEKQDEYQDYVDQLMEQWESKFNSVAAKQQDEAAKDYSEEMGKIMTGSQTHHAWRHCASTGL